MNRHGDTAGAAASRTALLPRTDPLAGVHEHRAGTEASSIDRTAGNRLLILILFWSALATSVALWWFDTPAGSIVDTGGVLTAVGRITGMVGGFLLLVQVLLMSRVAWLEEWIGANSLLGWHRQLGGFLLVVVLVHTATIIVGYAMTDRESVTAETWTMLTTYEDMISAFVATGILVAVALLAIRFVRQRLPYELWHLLHLAGYLVLLLSYGHQFATGQQLSRPGFATWYWTGLYLFVICCLAWGRLVEPACFNLRHRLRVAQVVQETGDTFSIYLAGRRLDRFGARAGQYFRWRFLTTGCWWQAHPFSLSAAPNPRWLRLTINAVGDHTDRLRDLAPGTTVVAEGPSGQFTADQRSRRRGLLIAGGSGIAPIRALLEEMPPGTVLIYRASTFQDLVFRDELDRLSWHRQIHVRYVLGPRDAPEPRHVLSPAGLRELAPDIKHRHVYLCGPPGLVSTATKALRRLRVPHRQIHLDPFEF